MTKKPARRGVGLDTGPAEAPPSPADLNPMSGLSPEERMRLFLGGELQLSDVFELRHAELYEICRRGQTLYEAGKIDEAEQVFEGLTALQPMDANFHVGLGVVYQRQGRHAEAKRELDRAVSLNNTDPASQALLAEVSLELGDIPTATAAIQRVIELDPKGESGHSQRAVAMMMALQQLLEGAQPSQADAPATPDPAATPSPSAASQPPAAAKPRAAKPRAAGPSKRRGR